jgi:hypothetical protein
MKTVLKNVRNAGGDVFLASDAFGPEKFHLPSS